MTDMHGTPAEAGQMMRATARNIANLQTAVTDLQTAAVEAKSRAEEAKVAAATAKTAVERWKFLVVALGIVALIALAAASLGTYNWAQAITATDQLRQQAIVGCQIGNERAAGTVAAFDEFFRIAEGPHPDAKTMGLVKSLEAYVLRHNPVHNCRQAYSPKAAK